MQSLKLLSFFVYIIDTGWPVLKWPEMPSIKKHHRLNFYFAPKVKVWELSIEWKLLFIHDFHYSENWSFTTKNQGIATLIPLLKHHVSVLTCESRISQKLTGDQLFSSMAPKKRKPRIIGETELWSQCWKPFIQMFYYS